MASTNFIRSQKKKDMLEHNGYLYSKYNEVKNVQYWRCNMYYKNKCSGKLVRKNDQIKETASHSHAPDMMKIESKKVINIIKDKAKTQEPTGYIIASSLSGVSESVLGQLPTIPLLKKALQRERKIENGCPPNPCTSEKLILPIEYKRTEDDKQFLLFQDNDMLIFSTEENLQLLGNCDVWLADGTFKTAPLIFLQLFSIHVIKNEYVLPVVYALLKNKETEVYTKLLREVKSLAANYKINLKPQQIITDYELAIINVFKIEFGNVRQKGCFFHFCQNMWRKIQETGLTNDYKVAEFQFQLKLIPSLAFLPTSQVLDTYVELIESPFYIANQNKLKNFLKYFEKNYIGSFIRRNTRDSPRFNIELWNVRDSTLQTLPKTINNLEGWHNALGTLIGANHPSYWIFINALKKSQVLMKKRLAELNVGYPVCKNSKYVTLANRLKEVCKNYNPNDRIQYLKNVAQVISL